MTRLVRRHLRRSRFYGIIGRLLHGLHWITRHGARAISVAASHIHNFYNIHARQSGFFAQQKSWIAVAFTTLDGYVIFLVEIFLHIARLNRLIRGALVSVLCTCTARLDFYRHHGIKLIFQVTIARHILQIHWINQKNITFCRAIRARNTWHIWILIASASGCWQQVSLRGRFAGDATAGRGSEQFLLGGGCCWAGFGDLVHSWLHSFCALARLRYRGRWRNRLFGQLPLRWRFPFANDHFERANWSNYCKKVVKITELLHWHKYFCPLKALSWTFSCIFPLFFLLFFVVFLFSRFFFSTLLTFLFTRGEDHCTNETLWL